MTLTIAGWLVTALISNLIPGLVSAITKSSANAWVKQFVGGALAAVTALLTTNAAADGSAVLTKQTLLLALIVFAGSQLSYLALYKPRNANAKILPEFGLG